MQLKNPWICRVAFPQWSVQVFSALKERDQFKYLYSFRIGKAEIIRKADLIAYAWETVYSVTEKCFFIDLA